MDNSKYWSQEWEDAYRTANSRICEKMREDYQNEAAATPKYISDQIARAQESLDLAAQATPRVRKIIGEQANKDIASAFKAEEARVKELRDRCMAKIENQLEMGDKTIDDRRKLFDALEQADHDT